MSFLELVGYQNLDLKNTAGFWVGQEEVTGSLVSQDKTIRRTVKGCISVKLVISVKYIGNQWQVLSEEGKKR